MAISQRVPSPTVGALTLETNEAVKVTLKNYWWKRACALHEGVTCAFKTITSSSCAYPKWFTEGKTRLIPKQGDVASENQRPITCLNTSYKWFTSCVLGPLDQHLKVYDLMEKQQRGAKAGCSGTTDNLLIDRTVTLDCDRHKHNLSVALVGVRKAYDSVDHRWLNKIMLVHSAHASPLAQNKNLARHNAALKVLFWEMPRELQLSDTVPPWYPPAVPKPIYESHEAQAYWDIPVFCSK